MSDEEDIVDGDEEDLSPEETPEEQSGNKDEPMDLSEDDLAGSYWPVDWREAAAEMVSAGDQKAYNQELRRLERLKDPAAIYGMYRELESKMSSQDLIRVPDEDADEDELMAWRAAMGVPERPDSYLEDLESYDNGDPIDVDDPDTQELLTMMHEFGTPSESAQAILNYMHEKNTEAQEQESEEDDEMHWTSQQLLKDELGPAYKRTINNIAQIFRYAPGGVDLENEESVRNRLLGGRTADGVRIGDDPDIIRFLAAISQEIDPIATVMDTHSASGRSLEERLKEIDEIRRTDKKAYFKDQALQEEERRLLEAKSRAEARG